MSLPDYWRSALDPERVMQARTTHWQEADSVLREEQLTVEEPLELRLDHQSLAVIMRTPGHDYELAMGFLFSEGIIHGADEVLSLEPELDDDGLPLVNVVNITLHESSSSLNSQTQTAAFQRHFAVSSSCGLCGKNSIADLFCTTSPLEPDQLRIPASVIYSLPDQLRSAQKVFQHTGGLHAAALFSLNGELSLLREDVGRHNAVDKLVGHGLLHHLPPYREQILLVSGRTSYEIVQKVVLARIPCIAAISAPSSLAVELAEQGGVTLVGFLRGQSMNVYTHPERICAG
ncbi:MAG TPA: formate dehydrogenase accessory sulfurtransferase FdhD [Ktedonobacteraceae bacterium]|nr:formate dehydrogenase accessory sulfurtransferase FdhD [Ktedonobacteraceae bacterium]